MSEQLVSAHDPFEMLRKFITDAVTDCVTNSVKADSNLVARLRTYERMAWEVGLERQTVQVITSARRLLGDRKDIRPPAVQRLTPEDLIPAPNFSQYFQVDT